ncbi:MAG: glycosyltransferase [Gammaproteobacteria bacterium]|nr:glycosyltransferase [Gammaproteobacteria bacterium]
MKITQVMLAKNFGGAERLFVDLCLSLVGFEQEVQAICLKNSKSAEILSRHPQVQLDTISVLGTWDPFAPAKISRLALEHKSEVVQAHLARGALLTGKALKKIALPLVVTTHNYIDTKYYQYVTMLVPPTRDQYKYYLGKGVKADRLKLINHFTSLQAKEKSNASDPSILRIVTLGRLVTKKGFHVLLDAFAKLQERTKRKCELYIGGTGPEQEALIAQIETLDLTDKVKMVGWLDDVPGFLQEADLFVLPSLDEPFGIVVLEAMAYALPIVSSDSQGPVEILDEDCAWLSKTGDADSLATAMQHACDDYEERKRKSENVLSKFKQKYSKQVVIPEFLNLYASLLTTKNKPSQH